MREKRSPEASRARFTASWMARRTTCPLRHSLPSCWNSSIPERRRRAEPSEEVQVGIVVVPEEQHGLSDDARSLDRAPIAAVAGDLPVITHHVELSGRDAKGRLPGGRGYGAPERVVRGEVRLSETAAVYVDVVAGRIDGLARQRDDALDQVGVGRPRAV